MLRISKLADYGIVLAGQLAANGIDQVHAVSDLSAETGIPQPTASKVLKRLAREGVAVSQRGVRGGYRLARRPEEITLAEILQAIEGPIAVTECTSEEDTGLCDFEGACDVQSSWHFVNHAVRQALDAIRLTDLVARPRPPLVQLARSAEEATALRANSVSATLTD